MLLLMLLQLAKSNLYFSDSGGILNCTTGYLYNEMSCLSLCPTGYDLQGNICADLFSHSLFQLDFYLSLDLQASSIGDFYHPQNLPFVDSNKRSPVCTINRGFYFESTSGLISTKSWIPAPDFSIAMYIRVYNPGTVFQISADSNYFSISANTMNELIISLSLTNSSGISEIINENYPISSKWYFLRFSITQYQGYLALYNYDIGNKKYYGYEFRLQVENLTYTIGSLNNSGFTGFIYKFNCDNRSGTNAKIENIFDCPDNFNIFCYLDSSGNYQSCNGCNNWPPCTRANCNYCYSDKCVNCTGFGPEHCVECSDSSLYLCLDPLYCDTGSMFGCVNCSNGYVFVDSVCIKTITPTVLLNIRFDTFAQFYGNRFQSGENASTYAPYNNPESDDPFPLHLRGLYFNQSSYLTGNFSFNISFTILAWLYHSNANILNSTDLDLSYNIESKIRLTNSGGAKDFPIRAYFKSYGWKLIRIVVEYQNNITTFTSYFNSFKISTSSIFGYYFYSEDSRLDLMRGNSALNAYQLIILQYPEHSIIIECVICNTVPDGLCLSNVGTYNYFSSVYSTERSCNESCVEGCRTWGTCNQCSDILCENCNNFNETCQNNTSYNPCLDGFELRSYANCCHPSCDSCIGPRPHECLTCHENLLFNDGICIINCPFSFTQSSNVCHPPSTNILLVLDLSKLENLAMISNNLTINSENNIKFYADPVNFDSFPHKNRGFYFKKASYMQSDPILLPFFNTFSFWARIDKHGILAQKDNFIAYSDGSINFNGNQFASSEIATKTWVQIHFSKSLTLENLRIKAYNSLYNFIDAYWLTIIEVKLKHH